MPQNTDIYLFKPCVSKTLYSVISTRALQESIYKNFELHFQFVIKPFNQYNKTILRAMTGAKDSVLNIINSLEYA